MNGPWVKTAGCTLVAAGLLLVACGCAATPPNAPSQTISVQQVGLSQGQTLQLARGVLLDYGFRIAKEDAVAGYLRTHPLSGAQFFEFWRKDVRGAFNTWESNLQSVQRTVEIRMRETAGGTVLSCQVRAERLSVPSHAIESDSQAYRMLSDSTRSVQRLKLTPYQERHMEWIDLGPDRQLSDHIVVDIVRLAQRRRAQDQRATQLDERG